MIELIRSQAILLRSPKPVRHPGLLQIFYRIHRPRVPKAVSAAYQRVPFPGILRYENIQYPAAI